MSALQKLKEKTQLAPTYVVNQSIPFPIYIFNLNDEVDPELISNACKFYQKPEYQENLTSVLTGWRSKYIPIPNTIIELDNLIKSVTNKISLVWNHCKNHNSNLDCSFRSDLYGFKIPHYWFNIYDKGAEAKTHSHMGIDLVAVYYASVPENSAPLILISQPNEITIDIKQGMLVLFSGFVSHKVPKTLHETGQRISISFNVIRDTSKLELS